MSAKLLFTYSASVFFIQVITAQCLRNPISPAAPVINDMVPMVGACGTGLAASNGGGLSVTSASPIAPTGLMVTSENAMEGQVAVGGQLPLIGSVAMDGAFPSAGAGAVSYGCGDGSLGIINEGPMSIASPVTPAIAAAVPAIAAPIPAISAPASAIGNPASSLLGSSFRFGPGKSPFAGAPLPGQSGPKGPLGRNCGYRY